MPTNIPKHILARKNDSPEEFKKQQDRIAKWVTAEAAKEAAKKFEEGQK